jgi:hypothetical protein
MNFLSSFLCLPKETKQIYFNIKRWEGGSVDACHGFWVEWIANPNERVITLQKRFIVNFTLNETRKA